MPSFTLHMLVRPSASEMGNRKEEQLLIVYQVDHANLAAQFASHWGNSNFEKPFPYDEMELAIRTHDDGWIYNDELPFLEPASRRPCGLVSFPTENGLAIDRDTIEIARKRTLYARLMISMHRTGIWQQRYGIESGWDVSIIKRLKEDLRPDIKEFVKSEEDWQKEVKEQNSSKQFSDAYIWANYRLMQAWDKMSLFLCYLDEKNPKSGTIASVSRNYAGDNVSLNVDPVAPEKLRVDPWPFDQSQIVFRVRALKIANKEYEDSQAAATELARASQELLKFELSR